MKTTAHSQLYALLTVTTPLPPESPIFLVFILRDTFRYCAYMPYGGLPIEGPRLLLPRLPPTSHPAVAGQPASNVMAVMLRTTSHLAGRIPRAVNSLDGRISADLFVKGEKKLGR